MNFEKMKNFKNLNVFSHRIAEILIMEHGIKHLSEIKWVPDKKDEAKSCVIYIFRNSPELFETFKKYVSNPSYEKKD